MTELLRHKVETSISPKNDVIVTSNTLFDQNWFADDEKNTKLSVKKPWAFHMKLEMSLLSD